MGCGCGGKKKATPRSAGAAHQEVTDPRPHLWRVEFPNGAHQDFSTEWQANAARSIGNGGAPHKVYLDRQPGQPAR